MFARTSNFSTRALASCVFAIGWLLPCGALAQSATVTVRVIADNPDMAPEFPLELAGKTVSLASGESTTSANVPDDQFLILVPQTDRYRLTGADCRRAPDGENVPIQTYPDDRNIYLKTGANADISCTLSFEERRNRQTFADTKGRASSPPRSAACCSCDVIGGALMDASTLADNNASPCDFLVPASWDVVVGDDGANVSVVASPACDGSCPTTPTISLTIAMGPNSNADAMAEVWPAIMPTVGTSQCGSGAVRFFGTPGSEPNGSIGGVRFHLLWAGEKYDGAALFSCGAPGGWIRLQEHFINTFHGNAGTTFGSN